MKKSIVGLILLSLVFGFSAMGCLDSSLPIVFKPHRARRTVIPYSKKFAIAVFNFEDKTQGRAGDISRAMSDMLVTTMAQSDRFAGIDLGQIHNVSPNLEDHKQFEQEYDLYLKAKKTADGILVGSITEVSGGGFRVNYRLINSRTDVVLVSETQRIGYTNKEQIFDIEESHITQMVKTIESLFPSRDNVGDATVLKRSDKHVIIDVGKAENIQPGMTMLVLDTRQLYLKSPRDRQIMHMPVVGEVVVVSVGETHADCILYNGNDVFVGDRVMLK